MHLRITIHLLHHRTQKYRNRQKGEKLAFCPIRILIS